MKTTNTFIRFQDDAGDTHLVSIADLVTCGVPIDEESGDEMEQISDELLDEFGHPVELSEKTR